LVDDGFGVGADEGVFALIQARTCAASGALGAS
jgi:hypothetical protein